LPYEAIPLDRLLINRANDRHGELENETAAMAELFRLRENHMRNLAEDIVREGAIYDPPLVGPEGGGYLVFDGNRRITCLKLIIDPERAPSQDLQAFFRSLRDRWEGDLPTEVMCQVEDDRDVVDAILFRRHTGSQAGVGQSDWDDRAKRNFIERTGRGGRVDVADQIEALLGEEARLPDRNIPRSTMNRLLSSEANRERVGISVQGNRFRLTHQRDAVVNALARIADDLSSRRVVLGDLWDNRGKLAYLNRLEAEGVLPAENALLPPTEGEQPPRQPGRPPRGRPPLRPIQRSFIPADAPHIPWRGEQARARAIWDELQSLPLAEYPNAISALARILLELSVEGYLGNRRIEGGDSLSQKVRIAADDLLAREVLDQQYYDELNRLRQHDELISIRIMQRYVHSATFAPLPRELITYWMRLGRFIVACLSH
jgi:hypothetical protein